MAKGVNPFATKAPKGGAPKKAAPKKAVEIIVGVGKPPAKGGNPFAKKGT